MKLKDSGTQVPQVSPALSPSPTAWLLHWISAPLVLFLLGTSLASGLGVATRLFPGAWMDWHLSTGIALLAVTILRMWVSLPWNDLGRQFSFNRPNAQVIRSGLLLAVFLVALSGLTIFQKPPFGPSGTLFGYFPMPTLIRFDHSLHNVVIGIHVALSCAIAVLLVAHTAAGLQRVRSSGRLRLAIMLWPWR
jgi:cytochrome b561